LRRSKSSRNEVVEPHEEEEEEVDDDDDVNEISTTKKIPSYFDRN
jgi:hypothetical protein